MRCENCFHVEKIEEDDLECRRFPPVLVPARFNKEDGEFWLTEMFPSVEPDDYCGEYRDGAGPFYD